MSPNCQFCSVFLLKGQFYLGEEEGVGGPRRLILPPRALPNGQSDAELGIAVAGALKSYRETGQRLTPPQWEALNQQLLELFGFQSIRAFERAKKEVTVRRSADGEVRLFGAGRHERALSSPDLRELGQAIKQELELI